MPARPDPGEVRRIACIGAGVIGGGWAAHFLGRGYEVVAWDPAPHGEARLRELVAAAWPALEALGLAAGASPDRLSFARGLEAAVAGAEFVQESAPERLDLKREILAAIDRRAPPEVVIASSTSGYAMTEMQPEVPGSVRMVVGHPFNPPYLIPLVEVVGGTRTDPGAIAWATAFYRTAGKYALQLERELPGFVANRLQDAARPRSSRSTPRSARDRDCAGRSWGLASPSIWPAPAAWRTCSTTSAPRSRSPGPGSRRRR
jgi:carnitine 3-dehydrogenase